MELGQPLGLCRPGWAPAIRCGWRPACRCTATSSSKKINPFQAGLGFACHLAGYDFPGRDALLRHAEDAAAAGPRRTGDARAPVAAARAARSCAAASRSAR